MGRKDSGNKTVAIKDLVLSKDRKLRSNGEYWIDSFVYHQISNKAKDKEDWCILEPTRRRPDTLLEMVLCFPIARFVLSMLRRASFPPLNVCERENVCVSVCPCDFQVGVTIPPLPCCFISPWTVTVENSVSLNLFLLNHQFGLWEKARPPRSSINRLKPLHCQLCS